MCESLTAYLLQWKTMQETSSLDLLRFEYAVFAINLGIDCGNITLESEGQKVDHCEQVD